MLNKGMSHSTICARARSLTQVLEEAQKGAGYALLTQDISTPSLPFQLRVQLRPFLIPSLLPSTPLPQDPPEARKHYPLFLPQPPALGLPKYEYNMKQQFHFSSIPQRIKSRDSKDNFTPLFMAVLLTTTKRWKQPECPSMDD